jgi:hypothetical protein
MGNPENTSLEAAVRNGDDVTAVFPANGSLRPKRRWKSDPVTTSPKVTRKEPVEKMRPARFRHYRMKKSGHAHRIYPQVVAQVGPAPASLPAAGMTNQIVSLVRSLSPR